MLFLWLLGTTVFLFGFAWILVLIQRVFTRRKMAVPGMPLRQRYKESLVQHFIFYNKLKPKDKGRFERKVQYFISSKEFVARGMSAVSDEMKALISASAVQLTFGLPSVSLSHFRTILVYPDNYYSHISRRYHKGEVNPAFKIIVLSWRSFVDGYIEHKSGINLGLHEMAHALHLENQIPNRDYNFFDKHAWKNFSSIAENQIGNGNHSKEDLFRKYSIKDIHEFFAVTVENFFERPILFRSQKPELYRTMTRLLNQDPAELEI